MNKDNSIQKVSDAINSIHFCDFERGQLIFRGQTNSKWDILPSLFRESSDFRQATLFEAATMGQLFFEDRFPYVHSYDPIQQLIVAQHFGMPTRLIDWTYDILIGLFFACYDPQNENLNENGRLTLVEKSFFNNFNSNSIDLEEYNRPLSPEKVEQYSKRLEIDSIYVVEPLIRNPRLRVQDGCFTFFPWKFHSDDNGLLTFNKYIREQRKYIDEYNKKNEEKQEYIFVVSKEVDKKFKKSILEELDTVYGISDKSLFIDSNYSKETETYFQELRNQAKKKSIELA